MKILIMNGARNAYVFVFLLCAFMTVLLILPNHYLPNVDDVFLLSWAYAMCSDPVVVPTSMSNYIFDVSYFTKLFNIHARLGCFWFDLFGWNVQGLAAYRTVVAVLSGFVLFLLFMELKLDKLIFVAIPLAVFTNFFVSGFRPEISAIPVFLFGLYGLFGRPDTANARWLGLLCLYVAPLIAPSFLAFSSGAVIAGALSRLRVQTVLGVGIENFLALLFAICLLGLTINFDFATFAGYVLYVGESHRTAFSFDMLALGVICFCAAAYAYRLGRSGIAALLVALGLGYLFSLVLHHRAPATNTVNFITVAVLIEALVPWRRVKMACYGIVMVIVLLLMADILAYFALSRSVNAGPALAAIERLRGEGKTIYADEISFVHLLDFDFDENVSWTWSLPYPRNRPRSFDILGEADAWVITPYTFYGYLKGRGYPELYKAFDLSKSSLPYVSDCVYGRGSCRLPKFRWNVMIIDRTDSGELRFRIYPDQVGNR